MLWQITVWHLLCNICKKKKNWWNFLLTETFPVTVLTIIPLFVLVHPPSPWLNLFYEAVVAVLQLFSVKISKEICSFDLLLETCWAHCITVNLTHAVWPKAWPDFSLFFNCKLKFVRHVTGSVMTWWMVLQVLSYINPVSTYWSPWCPSHQIVHSLKYKHSSEERKPETSLEKLTIISDFIVESCSTSILIFLFAVHSRAQCGCNLHAKRQKTLNSLLHTLSISCSYLLSMFFTGKLILYTVHVDRLWCNLSGLPEFYFCPSTSALSVCWCFSKSNLPAVIKMESWGEKKHPKCTSWRVLLLMKSQIWGWGVGGEPSLHMHSCVVGMRVRFTSFSLGLRAACVCSGCSVCMCKY